MFNEDENYRRVQDHWHYTRKYLGFAHSICNLKYKTPKEIPVVFHNGSNYDYHFIVKEQAEETPLSERLHKDKWSDCKSDLEYVTAKDSTLTLEGTGWIKNYETEVDEDLSKRFQNTYKFCDEELSKVLLML